MNIGDKAKIGEKNPVIHEIIAFGVVNGTKYAWIASEASTSGLLVKQAALIPYVEPIKVGDLVVRHASNVAGEVIQLFTHGNTDWMVVIFPSLGYQLRVVSDYKRAE